MACPSYPIWRDRTSALKIRLRNPRFTGITRIKNENLVAYVDEFHDRTLLPMDAMAIRPFLEDDLEALVAQVPVSLAPYLAELAVKRA